MVENLEGRSMSDLAEEPIGELFEKQQEKAMEAAEKYWE